MPKRNGGRQVYLGVRVDLDAAGSATGAGVDCEGAPWAYCRPDTWDPATETWNASRDSDAAAAEAYMERAFAAVPSERDMRRAGGPVGAADSAPAPAVPPRLRAAALRVLAAFGLTLGAPMAAGPERDAALAGLADAIAADDLAGGQS